MIKLRRSSVWQQPQIDQFLQDCVIPIRLACIHANASPLVCSLWYLYDDGVLWCATQRSAGVVAWLEQAPDCGFEVAPETMPYRGVRGQGKAVISASDGADILLRTIDRYVGSRDSDFARWLMAGLDTEVAIRIEPEWMTAWDFGDRMASITANSSPG